MGLHLDKWMKKENMLTVRNHELVISTWLLSKKLGKSHQHIKKLMERHKIVPFDVGFVNQLNNESDQEKRKRGRPIKSDSLTPALTNPYLKNRQRGGQVEEFFLTEYDARRLIARMSNTPEVLKFTDGMINDFMTQRREIDKLMAVLTNNKLNAEWLADRKLGKVDRRLITDKIQIGTRYAVANGSLTYLKKPQLMYSQQTLMIYKGIVPHLCANGESIDQIRDKMSIAELRLVSVAERLAGCSIEDTVTAPSTKVEGFSRLRGNLP